jgi:hypothetical protein
MLNNPKLENPMKQKTMAFYYNEIQSLVDKGKKFVLKKYKKRADYSMVMQSISKFAVLQNAKVM